MNADYFFHNLLIAAFFIAIVFMSAFNMITRSENVRLKEDNIELKAQLLKKTVEFDNFRMEKK